MENKENIIKHGGFIVMPSRESFEELTFDSNKKYPTYKEFKDGGLDALHSKVDGINVIFIEGGIKTLNKLLFAEA